MIARSAALLTLIAAAALLLAWPSPARGLSAPLPGDCIAIAIWSNGVHTSLSLPADMLAADHPLRLFDPEARFFLVGWGDEAFYRAEDAGLWTGLRAIVPPSPSVVHVIGAAAPVERFYRASRLQSVALSRAQAEGLAAFLRQAIVVDADGLPLRIADGHAGPRSGFLRARGHFHAFNVCNHWTARALRAAGLDVGSRLSFRADGVLNDAARTAPATCAGG